MVLKHGPWSELWKIGLLPLTTFASDVSYGSTYPTDSLHRPCNQCSCVTPSRLSTTAAAAHPNKMALFFSGMWHGWATCMTCLEPYIRQFAVCPRTGGTAQDVHITPGYGPRKRTFSRSTTDWTQRGDLPNTERWRQLVEMAMLQSGAHQWWWWWCFMHCFVWKIAW